MAKPKAKTKTITKVAKKPLLEAASKPERAAKIPVRVKHEDADSMAKRQRDISVSEFFAKNRHLLGFDNPRKALLTAVKEAVDNSLDACEEAGILPHITVKLTRLSAKVAELTPEEEAEKAKGKGRRPPQSTEKFLLEIIDNGPGIVSAQISRIFGKLLYGSKFHRLKMSRGQQGIGIAAAGMYGQMTTGIPVKIFSKIPKKDKATYVELKIDTKTNKPIVLQEKEVAWAFDSDSGTSVALTLEGRYHKGRQSIEEFVVQNTLSNPHAQFTFVTPDGEKLEFPRSSDEMPPIPKEIQPHPYGVELGEFHRMASDSSSGTLKKFLQTDFCRVSDKVAGDILKEAGVKDGKISSVSPENMNKIHEAIKKTSIMAPPTDCVVPIGENLLIETLKRNTKAEFFTSVTRTPSVYRGNPFLVECALAYGGDLKGDEPMQIYRFANRVPLMFQPAACATVRVVIKADWKNYGLSQSRGALPVGPIALLIHVASVWVPFTSEGKEAIADYPEIKQEIRLAILDCARKLSVHLSRARREAEADRKANYIDTYIPFIGEALQSMLKLNDGQRDKVVETLRDTLEKSKIEVQSWQK